MPAKSALTLHLEPVASSLLKWVFGLAHALALLSALVSSLPAWLKASVVGGLLVHWRFGLRSHIDRPAYTGLLYEPERGWRLELHSGSWLPAQVLPSTVVTPWFVVLHLRTDSGRHDWLIVRDSLPAEDFRKLRVGLRLQTPLSGAPNL